MKKKMLLASWIFFALTLKTAQASDEDQSTNESIRDTIILTLDESTKVLLIGDDIKSMVKYSRLDSLKTMLIEDVKKAQKQTGYPTTPKTTHYFVTADGKRRLKTESEDFLEPEVNVEKEKQALSLNLPPCVFIIHDLATNTDSYLYVKDPGQLARLQDENLSDGLNALAKDKELQRHYFRIDLEKESGQWKVKDKHNHRQDMLELSPTFGLGMIGSQWSPTIGANISLLFTNKYSHPTWKAQFGLSAFSFTPMNLTELSSVSLVQSYNFRIMGNMYMDEPRSSKTKWFGLEAGWLKAPSGSILDKAYQFGIHTEGHGPFDFSIDVIKTKNKTTLYGATLTIPF